MIKQFYIANIYWKNSNGNNKYKYLQGDTHYTHLGVHLYFIKIVGWWRESRSLFYIMFTKFVFVLYQCIQTRVLRTSICVHWYRTNTNFVNYLSNDLKQSCYCLSNDLKQSCFQITFKKINVKSLKNCEKSLCKQSPFCTSVYRQWLNKHVFLFNYPHELLMSLISLKRHLLGHE